MRQVGALGLESVDHCQRFLEVEVCRMRLEAKGVENQGVEAFKHWPALVGDLVDIRTIGKAADPEAEDVKSPVSEPDRKDGLPERLEGLARFDADELDERDPARGDTRGTFAE